MTFGVHRVALSAIFSASTASPPFHCFAADELNATCSEHYVKFYEPLPWQQVKRRTHASRIQRQRSCAARGLRSWSGAATHAPSTHRPRPPMPFLSGTKSPSCSEQNISWLHIVNSSIITDGKCSQLVCLLELITDRFHVIL